MITTVNPATGLPLRQYSTWDDEQIEQAAAGEMTKSAGNGVLLKHSPNVTVP